MLLLGAVGIALLASGQGSAQARTQPPRASSNAAQLAQRLLASLQAKADKYDRKACADFQGAVGISVDGLYGPETRAALGRYVPNPPRIAFKGAQASAKPSSVPMTPLASAQGAAATKAAKLASAAVARPVMPAKQAKGNAIAAQLRELAPRPASAGSAPKNTSGVDFALAKSTAPDVATHLRKNGRKYNGSVVKQFQKRAGINADGLYGPVTASALRFYGANAPEPLFKGANAQYVPPAVG